jgi:hypothetical protein
MQHKSLSVIRTNPALTANVKLVVNSAYELFLESFDSNRMLGNSRFKHYRINNEDFLFVRIPEFFKDVPEDIAFGIRFENDQSIMFDDYVKQFDDIYFAGCANVEDTWHKEEFECLAPLYINPRKRPSHFFIFRVDGTGIIDLTASNFKQEILEKLKCVTYFDLGKTSPLGQFLDRNYTYKYFPKNGLEIDFKEFEFSRWSGIDFKEGGFSNKSKFLYNELKTENPFFDFEKIITEGYKRSEVVHPNLLNLKFLFDDTPATPDGLRKYSINRYMGFYADSIRKVKTLTSYEPAKLVNSPTPRTIVNNVFFDSAYGGHYDPIEEGWKTGKTYYVFYNDKFHLLQRVKLNNNNYQYKIISDMLFDTVASSGLHTTDIFNKISNPDVNGSLIRIKYNATTKRNEIELSDGSPFSNSVNYADVFSRSSLHLLNIDGKYHVVQYDQPNDVYYLQTDYAIYASPLILKYYINSSDPNYTVTKSVAQVSDTVKPITFELFRMEFTEIVDFDNDLINTDFAWYEYDTPTSVPNTNEIKLYATDHSGNAQPKVVLGHLPVSSEYIADDEIYMLKAPNVLGDIWRKNDVAVKWGYQGSLSQNDQPYKLNNNFKFAGPYNRTCSPFNFLPDRTENNLDYFYVFQPPVGNYINHSLHLEQSGFDLQSYINGAYDYFEYIFEPRQVLNSGNIVRNSYKYSVFNTPIGGEPYHTLFRGLKFEVVDLKNIKRDVNNFITELSIGPKLKRKNLAQPLITLETENKNDYSNYRFSIIFAAKTVRINDTLNGFTPILNSHALYKKSGIDVYVNRKYRNILLHIYIYNDVELADVNAQLRDSLYTATNFSGSTLTPNALTLANLRAVLSDMNNMHGFDLGVRYWEIKEDGSFDYTQDYRPITFSTSNLPPALLRTDVPDNLTLDANSLYIEPVQGPNFPIYNTVTLGPRQPLARIFHFNGKQPSRVTQPFNQSINVTTPSNTQNQRLIGSQGMLDYDIQIFRYSGPYAPVFKQVQLFKAYEVLSPLHPYAGGNFLFDTTLTDFGKNTEQKYSKVNPAGSVLKLKKDPRNKSVYPMVDEFGYSFGNIFIFKSTWDIKYYYNTLQNYINAPASQL